MKFATTILFSTLASASIVERSVNFLFRRAEPTPELISREPLPDQPGLQTVLNSLKIIKDLTVNSTYTIGNFTGENIQDALSIQTATNVLNDATYNASQACSKIANLSVSDAEVLGAYTQGLAYSVNASIATLISKKPAFDKLQITSLVLQSLQGLMAGSYVFSLTVLQKVPPELVDVSAALSSQVGQSINQGIQCFNGTASACITTIVNPDRTRLQAIANETINGAGAVRAGGFTALAIAIFAAVLSL